MALFGTIFYGGGFYGAGNKDVPRDVRFYRTNVDNVYVFHWGFRFDFITPILTTADFELQLDTSNTFTSPNLIQFDSSSAIEFQNGDVRKGFSVPVEIRQDKTEQTWFARVRTVIGFSQSDFSVPLQFQILEKFEVEESENLLDSLPDFHVYNKGDLKKPVVDRTTLVYAIMNMYGAELDQSKLENILTATNNYINLCRDEQLFQNFGTLFNYTKPQTQEFVEYRECIRALILGSLNGSTIDAIQRVTRCFTGVQADLVNVRDRDDFFVTPILEIPGGLINGVNTSYTTSSDYKLSSLQVVQNGTVLIPGVDFTETHVSPVFGFEMTVPPTGGDVLQVLFDIGGIGDPEPIILDLSDTTTLTGTTTFTNGSKTVTGVGTLYTSELQQGNFIADDTGFVFGIVKTIIDDFNLELFDTWSGITGVSVSAKRINFNGAIHLTGTITFTNSDPNVTGTGSAFLSELQPGDTITDNSGTTTAIVQSITDNENLVLKANWSGSTGTNINARRLAYEESILWNKSTLAHGIIIRVLNPGEFVLEENLIKTLITPLLPAHVRVFFEFV